VAAAGAVHGGGVTPLGVLLGDGGALLQLAYDRVGGGMVPRERGGGLPKAAPGLVVGALLLADALDDEGGLGEGESTDEHAGKQVVEHGAAVAAALGGRLRGRSLGH
jgi:hypothetical protein